MVSIRFSLPQSLHGSFKFYKNNKTGLQLHQNLPHQFHFASRFWWYRHGHTASLDPPSSLLNRILQVKANVHVVVYKIPHQKHTMAKPLNFNALNVCSFGTKLILMPFTFVSAFSDFEQRRTKSSFYMAIASLITEIFEMLKKEPKFLKNATNICGLHNVASFSSAKFPKE